MLDIAYFEVDGDSSPGLLDRPAGQTLAEHLRSCLATEGWSASPITPWWDGVAFVARAGRRRFRLEVTPYFEDSPPSWSVQIVPVGLAARLIGRTAASSLGSAVDRSLRADPRISAVRWFDLARGTSGPGQAHFA